MFTNIITFRKNDETYINKEQKDKFRVGVVANMVYGNIKVIKLYNTKE